MSNIQPGISCSVTETSPGAITSFQGDGKHLIRPVSDPVLGPPLSYMDSTGRNGSAAKVKTPEETLQETLNLVPSERKLDARRRHESFRDKTSLKNIHLCSLSRVPGDRVIELTGFDDGYVGFSNLCSCGSPSCPKCATRLAYKRRK